MIKTKIMRQVAIDAYIAGILDGEAAFAVGAPTPSQASPRIEVNITNESVVDFLVQNAGGKKRIGITEDGNRWGNRRPTWVWTICGQEMCELVERVAPYLIIKNQHAKIVWEIATVRCWAAENRPGVKGWAAKNPKMIDFYQSKRAALRSLNRRGRFDYGQEGKDKTRSPISTF